MYDRAEAAALEVPLDAPLDVAFGELVGYLCLAGGDAQLAAHWLRHADAQSQIRKSEMTFAAEAVREYLDKHINVTADAGASVAEPVPLNARQVELVDSLRHPPVLARAQTLWYQAKAVELMGEFFFRPDTDTELFCYRQQRVARDRVDAVRARLRRDLAQVPTLEVLAREVGCSPFYLSRTFSKETGQTIPQFVRQLRMERAAELLKTGRYNVTEVALEVGYNSLSHFSQAFHQTFGCCPGLYPMPMPRQKSV